MLPFDPTGTLLRIAAYSVAAGVLAALLAALLIHLGSTRLPPRLPASRVWADWRQKRMVWGLSLVLTLAAALAAADFLLRRIGLTDLYWYDRAGTLQTVAYCGALFGYLLIAFLAVLSAAWRRRRRTRP
ncbi:MAG: hypothetical protein ACK47B_19955 [Armatimonadota bacterium]